MSLSKSPDSGIESFLGALVAAGIGGWFVVTRILIPLFYVLVELLKTIGVLLVKLFHFLCSALPYVTALATLFLFFIWKSVCAELENQFGLIQSLTTQA